MRSYKIHNKTRKASHWAGWGKLAPQGAARTRMYKKCGKKCFLGTKTIGNKQHPDFPICTTGTCKVNKKGVWAAYIRAKEWGKPKKSYTSKRSRPAHKQSYYAKIARRAKRMLETAGENVAVGK